MHRIIGILVLLLLSPLWTGVAQPAKKTITKLDDLPRHTYPITGTATEVVTNAARFAELATAVRRDIEADLAAYEIADRPTRRGLLSTLMLLDLLEGKSEDARERIRAIRELEDKPAAKLLTGLVTESRLDTLKVHADPAGAAFREAFQKDLAARLNALPWSTVEAEVKQMKGSYESRSPNLLLGILQSQIEPAVKDSKQLSQDLADTLIAFRSNLEIILPLKEPIVAALASVIDSHKVTKPEIWSAREVTLSTDHKLRPVVVGIWDSGVDTSLFPVQIFENAREELDGQDNDRNGFVDDRHGIAFDLKANPVPELLYPLENAQERLPRMKAQIKGLLDLRAAIDSPEATALKQQVATIAPDKVKEFMEDLQQFGNYAHGTHVAGIAAAGNPYARLLSVRITFDHKVIPDRPTVEQARKDAASYRAAVKYLKRNEARVVNMSWGGSLRDIEAALEANGVSDAEARRKEAREIFTIGRDGLFAALKSAPRILFVIAAGNSDNDVQFDEVIPSSFNLPNVLVVGAVDKAGDQTSFTSFGETVRVHANGYEVDSYIPGGDRLAFSGTSMAAPNVANLAAKLIALRPTLTPTQTIDYILAGIERGADRRIGLIHPQRSVEILVSQPVSRRR